MIKACVFDMDGTVLDTIGTITYYVNKTLEEFSLSPITIDECKVFVGNGARLLIERTMHSKGIDEPETVNKVLARYDALYNSDPLYLTDAFPGIHKLFEELKLRGISIAIVSNKQDFLTRPISERFFGKSVAVTIGGREGVRLKPHPDSVLEALSVIGAEPSETVYVGDTGVDMQTGKNVGARLTVGVLWGFRSERELWENGADVVVNEALQILDEVLKLD